MINLPSFYERFLPSPGINLARVGFADPFDSRVIEATRLLHQNKWLEPVIIHSSENCPPEETLKKGILFLKEGKIDGLVAGATLPTATVVKAAIKEIGPKKGTHLITGEFLIETKTRHTSDQTPFLFADCAVIPEPSPRALAAIAINASESYAFFTGKIPRVALLSFSTKRSAAHPLVDRLDEALQLIKRNNPTLLVDGELQVDAAIDEETAVRKQVGGASVAGRANIFIFPTLEAGNIGYKLVQRFSDAQVAGPLLWGLNRPMSDLSRGCGVEEIVLTALTVGYWAKGQ